MNEGIHLTIEPMTPGVKGLAPRLKYPRRIVPVDQFRGQNLKQIYVEKKKRTRTHG